MRAWVTAVAVLAMAAAIGCGGGGGGTPPANVCGDGRRADAEACDDGDLVSGDGCDANCTPTGCGNGVVTAGEVCDDGDLAAGDGCSATCQLECGDELRQAGEQCDGPDLGGQSCPGLGFPGGTLACGPACRFDIAACAGEVCGDGTLQGDEECDDGNRVDGDGCSATCSLEQPAPPAGTGWFAPGGTIGERP